MLLKCGPVFRAACRALLASLAYLTLIGCSLLLHLDVLAMIVIPAIPLFAGWFGWAESRRGPVWSQALAFAAVISLTFVGCVFVVSHARPNPFGYFIALLLFVSSAMATQTMAWLRQRKWTTAAIVFTGTTILILGGWIMFPRLHEKWSEHRLQNLIDKPLPTLSFYELSGTPIPETAWRGKITVINFWGTWCVNCIAEMPQFNSVYARYKNDPRVQFVNVNSEINGDDPPRIERFLARNLTDLPQALDPSHTSDTLGIVALPQTLVVDRRAHIRFLHSGFDRESGERTLSNEIEYLITSATN